MSSPRHLLDRGVDRELADHLHHDLLLRFVRALRELFELAEQLLDFAMVVQQQGYGVHWGGEPPGCRLCMRSPTRSPPRLERIAWIADPSPSRRRLSVVI